MQKKILSYKMKKIGSKLDSYLRSNSWSILLLLSVAAYIYIMFHYALWSSMGIPHLKVQFADMQAILSASDAYRDGQNPYVVNPYDPLGRRHVYPRPWLWLGYTGLCLGHKNLAAMLVLALFFFLCIGILRPENGNEYMISAALLLSPAVMLGVERANNDLIIFILLVFAVFCLNTKITALDFVAYFFLFLAGILKFYPVASFAIFVRIIKDNKKFWIFALFSAFSFGAYALFSLSDFQYLKNVVPKPHGRFTFGAAILFECILDKWPVDGIYIYLLIGSACFLAYMLSSKTGVAVTANDTRHTIFFLIGSMNLLFCFFTNTNYDYRCIFFILILPWIFERLKCTITPVSTKRFIRLLLFLLPVIVWNEAIITLIGLSAGAPGISNARLMVMVNFYVLEHLSTWVVITILLAFCIELLKAPVRDKMMAPLGKILR